MTMGKFKIIRKAPAKAADAASETTALDTKKLAQDIARFLKADAKNTQVKTDDAAPGTGKENEETPGVNAALTDSEGEVIPGESMPEHGDPNEEAELGESGKPGDKLKNIPQAFTDLGLKNWQTIQTQLIREARAGIKEHGANTLDMRDWLILLFEEVGEMADALREDNLDEFIIEATQVAVIAAKISEGAQFTKDTKGKEGAKK